jgi:hypothetical protein
MNHPSLFLPLALIGSIGCSSSRQAPETSGITTTTLASAPQTGGFLSATVASFRPGAPPIASIAATFWSERVAGAGVQCRSRAIASCVVRTCEPGGGARALDSGAITVQAEGAPLTTMTPDETGRYANPAGHASAWQPRTRVRFASAGGEVPAFATTLTAPPALDVLEPVAGEAPLLLDRTAGLTARWVPEAEGTVRVAVRQSRTAQRTALEGGVSVDCFYPRSAASALVPPEALRDLDASAETQAMVFAAETSHVQAGDHDVLVLVNAGGVFVQARVR